MKSIKQYIYEAVEEYRLNYIKATYNVQPETLIIQAPETFQESDIQQYINDKWLPDLPSNEKYSEKFFGKNHNSISDIYFIYDSFEHITDIEPKDFIEWDPKYNKNSNDEIKLDYFKLKNLKYVIEFDRFDMVDTDDDDVKENLIKIFKVTDSSVINDYPIEITFNEDSLEYRK